MSTTRGDLYDRVMEVLVALDADLTREEYVPDWPKDEIDAYRQGPWLSFTDRAGSMKALRRHKLAVALVEKLAEPA